MVWTEFNHIWSNYFSKEKATLVSNGREAIYLALKQLKSKKVALPTYTCHRVLQACLLAETQPFIIDCNLDLQIDFNQIPTDVDTVIVPHMFGIWSQTPKNKSYKIIEDCSQCIGVNNLGINSDIVIASTGPTKWLNAGTNKEYGGGIIAYNGNTIPTTLKDNTIATKLNKLYIDIPNNLKSRANKATELVNAGVNLIGKNQPNAWLRAMYFGDQKRIPYTPLHDLYPGFNCPTVASYKNKLDWISIFP